MYIDAAQSGVIEFLRPISEQNAIGGEGNTLNTVNAHETTDKGAQIFSNQRLTARQADLAQAQGYADSNNLFDFVHG